jgi:RNA polymerase sigma-70 factor (ECF subfamily)
MAHEPAAQELGWERFRGFLYLLAQQGLDPELRCKVDLSGVVQQTLLEAHQHPEKYREDEEPRRLAWLRKTLTHNLIDEVRKVTGVAHDVRREQSLQAAIEESAVRVEAWLAADQSSPSDKAIQNERLAWMLPPGGWLILGAVESLYGMQNGFVSQHLGQTLVYRSGPSKVS